MIGSESKKDRFATENAISERANVNLGIKILMHTISRSLNEINFNSRVASTKPYISNKNKMGRLKFATEHVIWTDEQWDCAHFNDESKFHLFACDGEGSFDADLRNDVCLSALKAALNLEEEL